MCPRPVRPSVRTEDGALHLAGPLRVSACLQPVSWTKRSGDGAHLVLVPAGDAEFARVVARWTGSAAAGPLLPAGGVNPLTGTYPSLPGSVRLHTLLRVENPSRYEIFLKQKEAFGGSEPSELFHGTGYQSGAGSAAAAGPRPIKPINLNID